MSNGHRHILRRRRVHSDRRGFTLLEMLVAVTLLALIMALLTGTLRFGMRVWETGERVDGEAKAASVQQLLFQWLHNTEQMSMPGEDGDRLRGVFEGDAHRLRFLGVQYGIGLPGGYYLNDLYIEETGSGHRALMLRRRFVQPGSRGLMNVPPPGDSQDRVLLDGVDSVEIAYFGRENAASEPAWINSWADRLDLPRLVRLRVHFPEGDRRHWPDLVIPLALARG